MTSDPLEPGEFFKLPGAILPGVPFASLDRDVPLLLLPVGIETRYRLHADPPALCIRIYPDPIHVDGGVSPARAALLPGQWVALGYDAGGGLMFMEGSKSVAADLHVGMDAAAPTWTVEDAGLDVDDGLAWMLDYDRAVDAGMAITIPLIGGAAPAADAVATLLVVGVDSTLDPAAAQAELSRVLDVHGETDGLGFVAQGTPTNNTDSVVSGWPPDDTSSTAGGGPDNAADFARALGLGAAARWRALPGGGDLGSQHSEAMRALLFEAVLGTMVRELLDIHVPGARVTGLRAAAVNDLRDWFIDRVTGGAPVPCVRIGRQPYGIVPVQRATEVPDRTTVAGQVEQIVALVIDEWRKSLELVPAMNPDDPDVSTDTAHESDLAAVLAGQPHPARLLLRSIGDYETDTTAQHTARQGTYHATIAHLDLIDNPDLESPDREIALLWDIANPGASSAFASIDDQIERWKDVRLGLPGFLDSMGKGTLEDEALDYVNDILDNLGAYERLQRPVRWLELDEYEGVLGEHNTNLLAAWFTTELDEWGDNGIVEAPGAPTGHRPADYLADLRTRFECRAPALAESSLDGEFLARSPLLYQLLDMTLQLVPQTITAENRVLRAFDQLAGLDAESLEWLVRETLGLGVHRLDAWATSVASQRLDELRSARATGIQIGGFGWVTDLAPRQPGPPGEGFVLAPSLPHAATAAILRAGWQAHGGGDALSPAAIDLRSDRVRAASWLLDGIRRSQPLGELLGQRFERWLHDVNADEQIRIVRQAVLDATDRAEMAPNQVVDGIQLLDLYRTDALSTLDPIAVDGIEVLEATFDAVNDVGTFEAVYQLAAANDSRAGAMLDTLALGTASPPELRSVTTPRSGRSVEHRVIGLWPPNASGRPSPGWAAGDRDRIAPALEAWVASVLPEAADVGFAVRRIESDGRPAAWHGMSLAELSVSALDAVFLVSDDPTRPPTALATLVAAAGDTGRAVEIDPQAPGKAFVSLTEFSVAAVELRRVIGAARPATACDVRPGAFRGEADDDTRAPAAAAEELTRELNSISNQLDHAIEGADPVALSTLVARLARLGLAVGGAPADPVAARALLDVVRRRVANMMAIKVDAEAPAVAIADRIAVVLGHRLPLLGSFRLAGSDGGAVIAPSAELASESDVDDWLDAVARVRSDIGRLAHAGLLATLLSPTGGLRLVAGQSPRPPGEQWAARHRPGPGSRTSAVFVVSGSNTPARGDSVCGLVFDQWSEVVPNPDEVAGLTFQYDAPSNRPPQAWLLAMAPRETPWSLTLVTETLLETLEWTTLRAVAPEDLLDYGRAIPTVFTPGTMTRWVDEATEVAG